MIGGLVGALLPTHFSVAQSFWLNPSDLWNPSLTFTMPDYSVYLYAVTEANTYTISFDANGWVWSMTGLDMTYDKAKLLPKNTFTNEWLSFLWWSENPWWPVQYLDQKGVKNLTTEDWGEVILYAQWWTQVSYTVEYYKENLEWWYDVVTWVQYGASDTVWVAEELSFTWFTYDSWNVNNVTTWIINDDGSLVLVMYYTRNEYSLTIKDRDDISVITWIKYWADIPLPSDPEWTWNFFDWWDNLPEDGKMPDNDLVIESTWTYGEHTITFDTDGWTEVDPITRDYGDPILPPENPTKEWYEFVGWEPTLPDTMPYDDIVVKAKTFFNCFFYALIVVHSLSRVGIMHGAAAGTDAHGLPVW